MKFTAEAYRDAALEHVDSARELLNQRRFALANYAAGLSVKCIFRSYSFRFDKSFDCRHDLQAWYDAARFDNIVPNSQKEAVAAAQGIMITHWTNSQRYCSLKFLRAYFKLAGLDRGIRGDFVKGLTRRTVEAAYVLVTLGNLQWSNSFKR